MLLTVERLNVSYGILPVLSDLSFRVGKGEIVSLVGANGAGKTTILRAVSGIVRPRSGRIVFAGTDIAGLPSHRVARMGIAHVPEGRGIFGNMTVLENLEIGAGSRRSLQRIGENLERVFAIFPRLKERARQVAGTLSGGEQQMLAIGRALVASPDLMLLDEPSMGLSPLLVTEIFRLIAEINRGGMSILLVEQNAYMALSVAHRAYVLETGRLAVEGKASDLRNDPKVKAAYLGDVAG
jgi:branched-chain amino acid transport system ATP-binding protein